MRKTTVFPSLDHRFIDHHLDHHLGRHRDLGLGGLSLDLVLGLVNLVLGLVNLVLGLVNLGLDLVLVTGHTLEDRDLTLGVGGRDAGLDHTPRGRVVGVAPALVDLTDARDRGRVRDLGRPVLNGRGALDPDQ